MARLEEWKPIIGYEGLYEVSSFGRVRSVARYVKYRDGVHVSTRKSKMLALCYDKDGYLIVGLSRDGKRRTHKVHRLVAESFLKNRKALPQINHKNGRRDDNRVANLEWCSAKDNIAHKFNVLKYNATGRVGKRNERIKNISTGEVFASLSEAARSVGCSHKAISYAIAHNSFCRGCKWNKFVWKG